MDKSTLLETISLAIKKEPKAQTMLINHHWYDVYSFVERKVRDSILADEITVTVFSKALNKLHLYDNTFEFKTWILTIAQNTIIDHWRKHKNEPKEYDIDIQNVENNLAESPEEILISQENSQHILKTLDMMDDKYKAIIRLRFFEEKSLKEIADELGLSIPNTKVRIMRAKKILAELLRKSGVNWQTLDK